MPEPSSSSAPDSAATASKRELLQQLKIDRESAPAGPALGQNRLWWLAATVVLVLGGAAWFLRPAPAAMAATDAAPTESEPGALLVQTAIARASSSAAQASSVLDATGYVVARRQATVSSKATGKVVEVMVEEGLQVQEGQLLARLDDSIPSAQMDLAKAQMAAAEAGLDELRVQIKQAKLDLGRTQDLAQRKLASQADLDRDDLTVDGLIARLARAEREVVVAQRASAVQQQLLDDMQIRAPFSGVVIAKAAQPGEMISPVSAGGGFTRTGICTIVDMASLEIEVDVNESYINRVYAGQPVAATMNAYPDQRYNAEVIAIIPAADRNKATVRVRVRLLDRDEKVLPDMGVRVAFLDSAPDIAPDDKPLPGVLVAKEALAKDSEGQYVYVVVGNLVRRRSVQLGDEQGPDIRVLDGLTEGQKVVRLTEVLRDKLSDGMAVSTRN